MKIFHTADWHLGKLVQGIYMTEDQRYILQTFIEEIKREQPDAIIIAGDLYDRAIPPTEAVGLLNDVLQEIVMDLKIPVIAIAGNHDSPSRLHFGSTFMKDQGLYITGEWSPHLSPVKLQDEYGDVYFHLIPYADPSIVRHLLEDESISSHQQAMKKIIERIEMSMDQGARHVFVGHAFITTHGEKEENTSDAERPLSIGGAEYVSSDLFEPFHYTALGHLHQAHFVGNETIRYSGSPLKYSISEENHQKGYLIVELGEKGEVEIEKKLLTPLHDVRTVEGTIEDLLKMPHNEDYVFVKLLDTVPVIQPMEKIRSVFPNAMHVERKLFASSTDSLGGTVTVEKKEDDQAMFASFFKELQGEEVDEEMKELFAEVLWDVMKEEDRA
ncbi:exonuclease sbcCD subunit D [Sporosarcina sp. P21c]|uniref:exonuclease SbcCD subunit D n=1 Tax=unclassified Sporosarcina TaxID=2647733 RepID=UPI000C1717B8|nr:MULTISPECIES: exonuclease SbcCD subunit D [unclassified Sporosarcina]PIC66708.1 exonuclease sbcCD subunit D [Sporosarcina sp. P16a]PIC89843.1 exonuclease sbcCD subunit D [Sporosarcina sp. P21c]PIC93229.1 exonuclease sbcCD subunit D [Sporosarcina sp. P25]